MLQKKISKKFTELSFRNPLLYVLLSIKIITVLSLNYSIETNISDTWGTNTWLAYFSGDSNAYIEPIENFIAEGNYYIDEGNGKVYAGRAPYYGSIFYLLRQLFGYYFSLDILAFLQILTDCFAGITIAIIVFRVSKTEWTFWTTLILYSLSFYQTDFTGRILTESLTNSSLIFFIYYLLKLFTDKSHKNYLIAGFWLSIAVVLKPYFAPLYLIILFTYDKSKKPIQNILSGTIFSISLIVIIIPFTIRNYVNYGVIQPFSSFDGGSGITEGEYAFRKYLQSIGESFVFWDPNCAGCLFTNEKVLCNYKLPQRVYTSKTDSIAIKEASNLYISYLNDRNQKKEKLVIEKFDSMREDYRNSKPFMYYIGCRTLLLSRFIFQNASYYIPNPFTGSLYYIVHSIKFIQYLLYYFITLTGLAGVIIFMAKRYRSAILTGAVPVYLILFFPLILRAIEWRFWSNSHYFLIMSTVLIIHYLKENKMKLFDNQKYKSN